ncbi:hypothetical protein ACQKFS_02545 [Pseudomonas guineae]|uniref:hypothetical protein n=1 Tax=Pseudomonas guineae TaxID=425504 RepID=UPI003CFC8CF7
MSTFDDLTDDMDTMLMSSLNDGGADYLNATGALMASGLEVIVDMDVERVDNLSGGVDRVMTIAVRKALVVPFDRKGAFRANADNPVKALGTKVWHIDGIAEDDGHLITFYVVP